MKQLLKERLKAGEIHDITNIIDNVWKAFPNILIEINSIGLSMNLIKSSLPVVVVVLGKFWFPNSNKELLLHFAANSNGFNWLLINGPKTVSVIERMYMIALAGIYRNVGFHKNLRDFKYLAVLLRHQE